MPAPSDRDIFPKELDFAGASHHLTTIQRSQSKEWRTCRLCDVILCLDHYYRHRGSGLIRPDSILRDRDLIRLRCRAISRLLAENRIASI